MVWLVGGRPHWVLLSLGPQETGTAPLLPRNDCGRISVSGCFQGPLNIWVSSLSLQEDFEEWVVRWWGLRFLCACVSVSVVAPSHLPGGLWVLILLTRTRG